MERPPKIVSLEMRSELLADEIAQWEDLLVAVQERWGDFLATPLEPYQAIDEKIVKKDAQHDIEVLWSRLQANSSLLTPLSARYLEHSVRLRLERLRAMQATGGID